MDNNKSSLIKTCHLSICFMMIFSAFNSTQNMVVPLYKQLGFHNLGNIALFTVYFTLAITSFFSAKLISMIGSLRLTFVISGFGYNLFVIFGLVLSFCQNDKEQFFCSDSFVYPVAIGVSTVTGFCAALIWVGQGSFLDQVSANPSNKTRLVGIFWACFQLSQVLGNTLSYFSLGWSTTFFCYIMVSLGLFGNILFIFLPNVESSKDQKIPEFRNMIKLLKVKEIKPLIFLMSFAGIIGAFYSGFLAKLITNSIDTNMSKQETNQSIAAVYIALGISQVSAGVFLAYIGDKMNLYTLITGGTLIAQIALILSLISTFQQSYILCFFIAGFWGFCDCIFSSTLQSIFNQDYSYKIEIFAIFKFVQSISRSVFLILSFGIKDQLLFILIVFLLQIISNLSARMLVEPQWKQLHSYSVSVEEQDMNQCPYLSIN